MPGIDDPGERQMLTAEEARAFYDRFGKRQDWQGFYEDVATRSLIARAGFEKARAVFEFGCGTGRFAAMLLTELLGPAATYTGCDVSATMVGLARARLAHFGGRARVQLTEGSLRLDAADGSCDRFVSNYVLDLLPSAAIATLLAEAHRLLKGDGRLCLVSLTFGSTPISRFVSSAWDRLHRWRPAFVGGCRPIELRDFVGLPAWEVQYQTTVIGCGIPSEVLVACKHL